MSLAWTQIIYCIVFIPFISICYRLYPFISSNSWEGGGDFLARVKCMCKMSSAEHMGLVLDQLVASTKSALNIHWDKSYYGDILSRIWGQIGFVSGSGVVLVFRTTLCFKFSLASYLLTSFPEIHFNTGECIITYLKWLIGIWK